MRRSLARQLYLHFSENDVAAVTMQAGEKSVGVFNYGLIERFQRRLEKFEKISNFADPLQQRAKPIAEPAKFRNNDDSVPVAKSVSTVYAVNRNGTMSKSKADHLGRN